MKDTTSFCFLYSAHYTRTMERLQMKVHNLHKRGSNKTKQQQSENKLYYLSKYMTILEPNILEFNSHPFFLQILLHQLLKQIVSETTKKKLIIQNIQL